jgi:SAM-dependent methyltransferase
MTPPTAREFWDTRADEDAFYFVDNRLEYGNPDVEGFWTEGEKALDDLLGMVGVELRPSDRVVEIGCGIGRLTRVMARRSASVRALDVSERMLELAREHNRELTNVEWMLGDGESLRGIASRSADAVISFVVFQHIPDPSITLGYVREIGRVLAPGGWAVFQVSNDPSLHRRGLRWRARAAIQGLAGRGPRGVARAHWLGSHVEIPALHAAASEGSMRVERIVGEGTQWCIVLTRRIE